MGFGNPASSVHVERKRHHLELSKLRARIVELEAENARLRGLPVYHANDRTSWRDGMCTCSGGAS